jgi:hypothetical protein
MGAAHGEAASMGALVTLQSIPPMTDPLSRHWQQPARERVLVDDTHALISAADFEKLLEYTASIPSGKYPGKMWRRREGDVWLLCWYSECDDPQLLAINSRKVLVA